MKTDMIRKLVNCPSFQQRDGYSNVLSGHLLFQSEVLLLQPSLPPLLTNSPSSSCRERVLFERNKLGTVSLQRYDLVVVSLQRCWCCLLAFLLAHLLLGPDFELKQDMFGISFNIVEIIL